MARAAAATFGQEVETAWKGAKALMRMQAPDPRLLGRNNKHSSLLLSLKFGVNVPKNEMSWPGGHAFNLSRSKWSSVSLRSAWAA